MIIWSGWGILSVLIAVVVGGGVTAVLMPVFVGLGLDRLSGLAVVVGLLAAAAANWMVGRHLNSRPGQELIDKATGQTVVLRRRHSLFFIKMEWWSVPLVAVALFILFATVFGSGAVDPGIRTGGGTKRF